jgi:hypothetical protein
MGNVLTDLFLTQGIFPGPNVRVTQAATNEARSESAIVVDPKNPDRLLGISKHFIDPTKYVFSISPVFSTDGGTTWQDFPFFAAPQNHDIYTDPSVTFDTSGAAWAMGDPGFFSAKHPNLVQSLGCGGVGDIETTQMLAQQSGNNGASWSPHPIVAVRCTDDDKGWLYCDNSREVNIVGPSHPGGPWPRPRPASPYHGRLYAIWAALTPLRFARSTDGGQTWSGVAGQAAGADVTGISSYAPDLAIGRDGTLHVFWHHPGSSSIQYLRSKDGGETFEGDGLQSGFPKPRDVVTGLTDITSGITRRVGSDALGWWPAFEGANFRVITVVAACCFGSQGIAVAWADARSGNSRIYIRFSTDGGDTWQGDPSGTPMLPYLGGDSHQFHPQLATTGGGVLGCAMYSYSQTAIIATKPGVSVLVAASFNQGTTWEFKPITDQPWDPAIAAPLSHGDTNATFIGEYFGFDAGKKEFHVLWTDTRHGNQDLFYCQIATEKRSSPEDWLPDLVATFVSPGVPRDGGGFIIVGGHIIRIPPWDPLRPILDAAAAIQSVSRIDTAEGARARAMLYDLMIDLAQQAKKQIAEG